MSNFLNNLEGAAKARMISNMKSALEATQEKMNQNQQAKFRSGVLKAAITTGKLAMAGVGAGMAVMALSNGTEAVLSAAEHSMAYGSEAIQAAEASKSAISAAMGYGLVSATLAAGVALVHKHFKCMEGQISEFKQDHPLKILQTALTETGCDAFLNSPEDYTDKQVQDAVGACVQYLSDDPETLEFALAWGNTLNTKQDNKNKMRFS